MQRDQPTKQPTTWGFLYTPINLQWHKDTKSAENVQTTLVSYTFFTLQVLQTFKTQQKNQNPTPLGHGTAPTNLYVQKKLD